ncbi:MAG: hypothetical protein HKO56_06010 [Bacteroidia bacterium]|nr:hypothetical protein [Bacteroidia bacterium]NNM16195.1 hypothetical protein [Bacteroidia bacterium]
MDRILIFCLIFLFSNITFGQAPDFNVEFSNSFGGSAEEDFFSGFATKDGGYLLTGLTFSTDGDIDSASVYDDADIFVVKCNSLGVKEWAKTFGGNRYDKARYVIEDKDLNIVVVGGTHSYDGDIDSTHGNSEVFVLKLDPFGNKIWMKQYGGTGYESGRYISQLSSGNFLVGGYSTSHNFDVPSNVSQHDGWLFMIDVDGNLIWSQTIGGSGTERLRGFVELSDGGYMTYGSSTSNDFQITGNNGGHDFWATRTDSVGNLLWSKLYGGSGNELCYHMIETSDGNFLMAGFTTSNDGDVLGNNGGEDGWLIKIDASGNLLSQTCLGGKEKDKLSRVEEDANGNYLTFGLARSRDADLFGANNTYSQEFWLAQVDSSLNFNWSYCIGGKKSEFGKELLINPIDRSIVLMGESRSVDGPVLYNHGGLDFWIVKLIECASFPSEQLDVQFWINSMEGNMIIDSPRAQIVNVYLYNLLGSEVFKKLNVQLNVGLNTIPIELNSSAFIAHVFCRNQFMSKKCIVVK